MTLRRLIPLLAALAAALATAAPVAAQSGGGVTVDPNSPSSKEYAIPLEAARRNATTGGDTLKAAPQGDRSAPLFGEGVGASGGSKSAAQRSSREKSQRSSTRSGSGSGPGSAVQDAIAGTRTVRATVPAGGVGSVVTIGAVALSVLLLGGVLGSIARRRTG